MSARNLVLVAACALAATAVLPAFAGPAFAGDVPAFLASGQKYVTGLKACSTEPNGEETGELQLTAKGMFGYEFGCTFVQVLDVPDASGDGSVYQYLATAVCGDDSGVSRGDLITLTPSGEDSLRVTSQNEFVTQLAWERQGQSGANFIVEKEFKRCPN